MSCTGVCGRIVFPAVLLAAFALGASRCAVAAETGSSLNLFVLDKLGPKTAFVLRANMATRDGVADPFFGYVDVNLRYRLSEHWYAEAGYRHAALDLPRGWRQEYRPMFGLLWRGKPGGWTFSNRHRIELRYFEGDARDRVRYRNESVLTSPTSYTALRLTPFVEEEFFYDLTDDELNINWFTLGLSKKWAKGKKWKVGYRLQSQKFGGRWSNRHVLVLGVSLLNFD